MRRDHPSQSDRSSGVSPRGVATNGSSERSQEARPDSAPSTATSPTIGADRVGAGLRLGAAILILVSGVVHFDLWLGMYGLLPGIGPLFLLNACSALVIALALVAARWLSAWMGMRWIEPLVIVLGVGFSVLTLAGFAISVTRGLFGFQESLTGTAQEVAGVVEVVSVVVLLVALVRWTVRERAASGSGTPPGAGPR